MSDGLVKIARSHQGPPFMLVDGALKETSHVLADALEAQAAEITRLRAELATARRDALAEIKQDTDELIEQGRQDGMEQAAQIVEECYRCSQRGFPERYRAGLAAGAQAIAAAIRATAGEGK